LNRENTLKGLVTSGSHNLFTVRPAAGETAGETVSQEIVCRIKGKVLKNAQDVYNPIAPGDWVTIEKTHNADTGLILGLQERRNKFSRFNQKGRTSQLLAANVDQIICITTADFPPFRPRFIDRILLQADIAGIEAVIVCNKSDLAVLAPGRIIDNIDVDARLNDFVRIGYKVMHISAKTGQGLEQLKALLAGKTSVLTGQSGVGKSSLINALDPQARIKTGKLNEKYKRGNHTTTMSFMIEITEENPAPPIRIIDTPGLRRFVPDGVGVADIVHHMREFEPFSGKCGFGLSCSHRSEAGCKIIEAVNTGDIHPDRYDSFLRIHDELSAVAAGKTNAD